MSGGRLIASIRESARLSIRAAALESAERHFMTEGFEAARVEAIAADAGIARKTLFNYFQTKENLLVAVIEEIRMRMGDEIDETAEPFFGDIRDAAPLEFGARVARIAQMRWIFEMGARYAGIYDIAGAYRNKFREADLTRIQRIAKVQALGGIRRDLTAADIGWTFESLRNSIYRRWLMQEGSTFSELCDRVCVAVSIFMTGLTPAGTDGTRIVKEWQESFLASAAVRATELSQP